MGKIMSRNSEKIPARRIVDSIPEAFISNTQISKELHRRSLSMTQIGI